MRKVARRTQTAPRGLTEAVQRAQNAGTQASRLNDAKQAQSRAWAAVLRRGGA
jgi:hypothetical protein